MPRILHAPTALPVRDPGGGSPDKRFSAIQPTSRIAMPAKPRPMKSPAAADDVLDQCRAGAGGKAEARTSPAIPATLWGSQIHSKMPTAARPRGLPKERDRDGISCATPAGIWLRPIGQGQGNDERCPGAEMA